MKNNYIYFLRRKSFMLLVGCCFFRNESEAIKVLRIKEEFEAILGQQFQKLRNSLKERLSIFLQYLAFYEKLD